MSEATSLLGEKYAKNFRLGFLEINKHRMRDGCWLFSDTQIYDKTTSTSTKNAVIKGDIDAGCIITETTSLKDLLLRSCSVISTEVIIPANTLLLVEATNKEGSHLIPNVSSKKICYIDRKVAFHRRLKNNEFAFNVPDGVTDWFLLLIYNGTEHKPAYDHMNAILKSNKLNGIAVWCGNETMNQWPLSIQNVRLTEHVIAQDQQIIEKDQQIIAQDQQLIEKDQQIIAQDQQIIAQDQQIIAKDKQLIEKDKQLMEKDEQLNKERTEKESFQKEIEELKKQLATQKK